MNEIIIKSASPVPLIGCIGLLLVAAVAFSIWRYEVNKVNEGRIQYKAWIKHRDDSKVTNIIARIAVHEHILAELTKK